MTVVVYNVNAAPTVPKLHRLPPLAPPLVSEYWTKGFPGSTVSLQRGCEKNGCSATEYRCWLSALVRAATGTKR